MRPPTTPGTHPIQRLVSPQGFLEVNKPIKRKYSAETGRMVYKLDIIPDANTVVNSPTQTHVIFTSDIQSLTSIKGLHSLPHVDLICGSWENKVVSGA